jgi:polynucleotide 5'-kinase involved in rRNA processing
MANKEVNPTAESLSNLTVTPPPVEIMYKGLSIPFSWKEKADTIAYDSCTCPPPIVFICGPGNTGKSVFGRVILDTLFKR